MLRFPKYTDRLLDTFISQLMHLFLILVSQIVPWYSTWLGQDSARAIKCVVVINTVDFTGFPY